MDLDAIFSEKLSGIVSIKGEQKEAISAPLKEEDMFAVFPTVFGKSLIYKLFVEAKRKRVRPLTPGVSIVVVSPPKSIIAEKLTSSEFYLSAVENFTLFAHR